MIAKEKRNIKPGIEFDHLFPTAELKEITVKHDADVGHTVKFIPKVVGDTLFHTKKIARRLQESSLRKTCNNIWDFVYQHIAYKKDEDGKEQVRSPARAWHDRSTGVDCDCYTVFISSILSNLRIPHKLRITKYSADHFQHIYPIVPLSNGENIILDCVVNEFNYEEPYTEKKDFTMELTYLNGVPDKTNLDTQVMDDSGELGKLFDFLKKKNPAPSSGEPQKGGKLKEILKKGLNVINKVNPATVVLRNGVLAAMKLNVMKVSQRLKYAYLSDAEAQKRGVDMAKFQRLKQTKDKLEKIFYGAGGKPENLKNAILTGKGNANKEVPVSGLNGADDKAILHMNVNTPLHEVLGQEIYYSENMQGLEEIEGLNGLGEPITAASIGAASGIMAAIAGLLKSIGSIFPKRQKESADFENTADANTEAEQIQTNNPQVNLDNYNPENDPMLKSMTTDPNATTSDGSNTATDPNKPPAEQTFWEKNKKWIKPTAWVTGILTALGIGYKVYSSNQKKKEKKKDNGVSGVPKKKYKKKSPEKIKKVTLK
ncbi:MAG TPA: hypothetical protein VK177_14860 [Flavobacteriales bacterium]|nr:hypothetical protein [Flavobacteriales bacterium]